MVAFSPLETLILHESAYNTAAFAQGASVVREALSVHDNGLLIAPLRGAMPILWAAEGVPNLEPPASGLNRIEVPIGTYSHTSADNIPSQTSARRDWKTAIITEFLYSALDQTEMDVHDTPLVIVDEVQKGGTLPFAVRSIRRVIEQGGFPRKLSVIAAQDIRKKVVAEEKTQAYRQLSSNSVSETQTTVVPLPLIASDKATLLDTVDFFGPKQLTPGMIDRFHVTRNLKAEELFRTLGTMARLHETAHDETFLSAFVNAQGLQTERAANRVELWLGYLTGFIAPAHQ